ncbi:type II secretion system protein [Chitinimonas lacunae]|uniref:Type II secretion system protein n=1 Tax=Chitinimonas lacunae TaxID=1963018 RepID=A0ABV8MUN3_9NEIS
MNRQTGFTLIELIAVILILGILAAVAAPKLIDLGSDARSGVVRGLEGSMRAANTMLYAKAAAGSALGATGSVTINGTAVSLVYGYASSGTELAKVMDLTPAADFTVAAGSIQHAKGTTPASCQVAYTAAASAGAQPTYTTTVTGC